MSAQKAATRVNPKTQKGPIGEGRAASGPISSKMVVVSDLDARLAKFKTVRMPFNPKGLTARERQLVDKLVQASQYMEAIYWRQSDPAGLALYKQLAGSKFPRDEKVRKYLFINGSRFDLLEENKPFVGTESMAPGRALYPAEVTREQIEQYVKENPDKKAEIYSGYTVVHRLNGGFEGVPYHVAFRQFVQPAAKLLREAAELSDDKDFAEFLRLRADALLTDDYYQSDLKWLDLKNPKIDVVFAPYETYLDELLGVKTSYGAAVMIRNEEESKKLALFEKYVPDIQDALPLAPEDRPSKKGLQTPMEVMDAPFRTGDFTHGYQAVATNLPNDPRVHEKKGTKKMFFKNFMDARVNYVILPLAKTMLREDQGKLVSGEGYLAHTMMHEIAHGLGPAYARVDGKQVDIREAIGPLFSALEEAKADVLGMFGLIWLMDRGYLPKERMPEFSSSYVGDFFRTVRFSVAEAHGQAAMMEFNYLAEQGVITRNAQSGRYILDVKKMTPAVNALLKELLEIEATGDRARAEKLFEKYGKMPADLQHSLKAANGIPVDIAPVFSWPVKVQ
ncbi:MAG TPA: Zn-dependent hydrolase [Terriglobales bacterium]|nr:Zn-dependent hydrolase [Terriglobales bacterium]